jgi:hypothetical protein
MGNVQVGAAIAASFRFVGEAWTKAWGVMLLLLWFTAVLQVVQVLKPTWGSVSLLGVIPTLFITTAATGALYRLRLESDHPGDPDFAANAAGLQWGGLEWRVMGANILVGVILGALFVLACFMFGIVLGVTMQSDPADLQAVENGSDAEKLAALGRLMLGVGGFVAALILIPSLLGLLYLGARLTVFTPLAADARAFDLGKAWTLSRGAVMALILGSLTILVLEFLSNRLLVAMAGKDWGSAASEVVSAAINVPLFAGLVLYVYRAQRGDTAVAATFS